ncbi:MAG: hypothetical protein ABI467_25415 [Kofleriaceae bacterium]
MKLVVISLLSACTTLGPMPATTGVSAVPMQRAGFEVQGGTVPGFYLSKSAQDEAGGAPIAQLAAVFEPDHLIKLPGLIVGGRVFGQSGDAPIEPYVGYRKKIGDLSFAGVLFGTGKRSSDRLASYHATRLGLELAANAPVWSPARWLDIDVQGALEATRIAASGSYCVNAMGDAQDCDTDNPQTNTMITGHTDGYFPAGTLTLGFEIGRAAEGVFHGVRLAILGSAGAMPLLRDGLERSTDFYVTAGFTLAVAFGEHEHPAAPTAH